MLNNLLLWHQKIGFVGLFYTVTIASRSAEDGPSSATVTDVLSGGLRRSHIVSYPSLFGKGCLDKFVDSDFSFSYLILLVHETREWCLVANKPFQQIDCAYTQYSDGGARNSESIPRHKR